MLMLPTASEFEEYVGKLGTKNDTHIVLYENQESGFPFVSTGLVCFSNQVLCSSLFLFRTEG